MAVPSTPPDRNSLDIIEVYLGHFVAEYDTYVRDSRLTIHEPLTPEVAYAALRSGAFSVSGYLARWVDWEHLGEPQRDCMTHVGAIDFDTDDGLEDARRVRSLLGSDYDIGSLLVASRRGAHLWVNGLLEGAMMPASTMRIGLEQAVRLAGLSLDHIEVFPKKSDTALGVGALRLPLMRHPKTGVRYPAYDPFDDREITKVTDLIDVMDDSVTTYGALHRLVEQAPPDRPYPPVRPLYRPEQTTSGDAPLVSALLAHTGLSVVPGRSVKCPYHDDRHASLSISADDLRAWCKSPTCDLYNGGYGLGSIELAKYLMTH